MKMEVVLTCSALLAAVRDGVTRNMVVVEDEAFSLLTLFLKVRKPVGFERR